MKIVWVSHGNQLYGAERCLLEFVQATYAQHDNYIVFPDDGKIVDLCRPYVKGITIIKTNWWASFKGLGFRDYLRKYYLIVQSIFKLKNFLNEIKPDLVISNSFVIIHGALAAKLAKVPHFQYIHEYVEEDHQMKFDLGIKISMRIANSLNAIFLVNAEGVKNKFKLFLPEKKIHTLKIIIDVPNLLSIPFAKGNKLTLLLSGRVSENKGQLDAINALKILKEKDCFIHLVLVGMNDGKYATQIRQAIKAYSLEDDVTLIEFCDDPFEFYKSADICLVTSKMEAFGRITIEAMKLGKPVIGTRGGETPFLIKEGQSGLLYNFGNYEELAQQIEVCYNNVNLVNEMKKFAAVDANSQYNAETFRLSFDKLLDYI